MVLRAEFFVELERGAGLEAVSAVRQLLPWCRQTFDWTSWGTGQTHASFVAGLRWSSDRVATLFVVYSYGKLEVGFAYIKPYPPFTEESRRRDLLAEMNRIPGVALPADSFDRRPSFEVKVLKADDAFVPFQRAMQTAADELRTYRDNLESATPK